MTESDLTVLTNILSCIVFELAVLIGCWIGKSFNFWKW